ncbi:MAG TPA: sulfatase-like hydrolase/transferase, partial [Clostridia bacterium]
NNTAPHKDIALMGTIFSYYGYKTVYTGKWHLDGSSYHGDGVPDGGFEGEWWYDGKTYYEEMKKEGKKIPASRLEDMWGRRVADRAIDFLKKNKTEPFVLVVSFDEPHAPSNAPEEYLNMFDSGKIKKNPNFNIPLTGKPELLKIQRKQNGEMTWEEYVNSQQVKKIYSCNLFIDMEIGRVIDAVNETHGEDTAIIYTTDHGQQQGSHGLKEKGPMMYEESCNVPFIIKYPGGASGAVCYSLASHLDIIPTMLDIAGIEIPESMHGTSLLPVLKDPGVEVRDFAHIGFHRFAINNDGMGGFYPVRCVTDGRYKLIINLFETDELYDLQEDKFEMNNLIYDKSYEKVRNFLHEAILEEMDRIRDPFRSCWWHNRSWRTDRKEYYYSESFNRKKPKGFPFQPEAYYP